MSDLTRRSRPPVRRPSRALGDDGAETSLREAPDAEVSTAPTEVDGQQVIVHKRANLFPRKARV